MTTTIKIKNIGPIKEADLTLNKINVFMGPQSCGKSTIAKLISYCQWVEKRYLLEGAYKYNVWERFVEFHRLHRNYFENKSCFEYESDWIKICYTGKNLNETIQINEKKVLDYTKTKNIYIPAERNFVSVIPNLGRYNETRNNVMELIYDWFTAKHNFTQQEPLSILNFDIDYYYQKGAELDMLIMKKDKKEIFLNTGSSGLQSLIPLIAIIEYLTKFIYCNKEALSVDERNYLNKLKTKADSDTKINKLNNNRSFYHSTQFIIEEPEQNLFPESQRDLIYYLLEKCLDGEKEHQLTITTHSPYILYSLNNCMLGGLVKDKMNGLDKEKIKCKASLIHPKLVSIYEIHNNVLKPIQQDDGLISANYFDAKMKELMDDFYVMLNYYSL